MENRKTQHTDKILTKVLLNQLNEKAWFPTMTKYILYIELPEISVGENLLVKYPDGSNRMKHLINVKIPEISLKHWTKEKFLSVFHKTMNSVIYDIIFV